MIKEYDKNGNVIYEKLPNGLEVWSEFDERNNETHCKSSNGFEYWKEYDENNNMIYFKFSDDNEYWFKYINNRKTEITEQEFKQIERIKLYLNNKKCSRFELMDI